MSEYREKLWEEIARNDPPTAKFMSDMHKEFKTRLHTYRWNKEPKHAFCVYRRMPKELPDVLPEVETAEEE